MIAAETRGPPVPAAEARPAEAFADRVGLAAPLTALLDRAMMLASDRLPTEAVTELRALSSLFPASALARLKLKSDLYEIAQLGRDYSPHIKEEFIKYAMRDEKALSRWAGPRVSTNCSRTPSARAVTSASLQHVLVRAFAEDTWMPEDSDPTDPRNGLRELFQTLCD